MKLLVSISLALFVFAGSLTGCGGREDGTAIAPAEARALVADGATLLDVRTPGEWERGHVEGARLIPIQELATRLEEIPRGAPVVVYCASGVRSAQATSMLREAGHDARDLGGMSQWDR